MFGFWEILIILGLALIFIGPKKLPDIAVTLGRALRDFRRATSDFSDSIDITPKSDSFSAKEQNKPAIPESLPETRTPYDESPAAEEEPENVETQTTPIRPQPESSRPAEPAIESQKEKAESKDKDEPT